MTLRLKSGLHSPCCPVLILASIGAAALSLFLFRGPQATSAMAQGQTPPTELDPAKVMGAQACLECHKAAIEAWQPTTHATQFTKLRDNPNAQMYATALGIATADITGNSVCVTCHGMRAEATATKSTTGVGCEKCHGASGGETGWLNAHGSYGAKGTIREQETPEHRTMRFAACDKAGMIRPENTYQIAKNCFECHLMYKHDDVVNKGGHHAGSGEFELVSWLNGEVAHNVFIDPKVNAKAPSLWMWRYKKDPKERNRMLYIAGKLAGMEIALRNVAGAKGETNFSLAMSGHTRDYKDDLSDIRDATSLEGISKIIDEYNKNRRKIKPDNKEALLRLADQISTTALDIMQKHDGSKFGMVDSLMPTNVRGKVFQPQ